MDIIEVLNPAVGGIIDTHAHYDDERFDEILPELMGRMSSMGVEAIINSAVDIDSAKKIFKIRERFPFCYCAIGYHPGNMPDYEPKTDELRALCKEDGVVAIGEIGLDYYWDKSRIELQKRWFEAQIELANFVNNRHEKGAKIVVSNSDPKNTNVDDRLALYGARHRVGSVTDSYWYSRVRK